MTKVTQAAQSPMSEHPERRRFGTGSGQPGTAVGQVWGHRDTDTAHLSYLGHRDTAHLGCRGYRDTGTQLTLATRVHAAKGSAQLLCLDPSCGRQLSTPLEHQQKGRGRLPASV